MMAELLFLLHRSDVVAVVAVVAVVVCPRCLEYLESVSLFRKLLHPTIHIMIMAD
jgi:hypothetical protein